MPKSIAMDLGNFYEKYYGKQIIFLFQECLTKLRCCAMIINNKMDNCIVKSVFKGIKQRIQDRKNFAGGKTQWPTIIPNPATPSANTC